MNNMPLEQLHRDLDDLANEAYFVDLSDRVVATSRRLTVRRSMTTAAAVVGVIAASAAVATAFIPHGKTALPAVSPSAVVTSAAPSTTPSAVTTPSRTPTAPSAPATQTTPPGTSGTTVTPPIEPGATLIMDARTKKIVNGTISIPAWPGGYSTQCDAGDVRFTAGHGSAGHGNTYNISYEKSSDFGGRVIYADLDGRSDDALVTIRCDGDGSVNPIGLLALRLTPGGAVQTLGWVIANAAHQVFDFDPLSVQVSDRVVSVDVAGEHQGDGGILNALQTRAYRSVNGVFKQVEGPTTFPVKPKSIGAIDPRNTTIGFEWDVSTTSMAFDPTRMHNGTGTARYVVSKGTDTYAIDEAMFTIRKTVPLTDLYAQQNVLIWATVTINGHSIDTLFTAYLSPSGAWIDNATKMTSVGQDGITGITSISGGTAKATIHVKTAGGARILTYVQSPTNARWVLQ